MRIYDYFKNFKTKKQLREEIKHLESRLLVQSKVVPPKIEMTHREIVPIRCSLRVSRDDILSVPEKVFLNKLACNFMDGIKPYIKYDVRQEQYGTKTYTGTLCVVKMEE